MSQPWKETQMRCSGWPYAGPQGEELGYIEKAFGPIKSQANLVPTSETKQQRKYWKRNQERNCAVNK